MGAGRKTQTFTAPPSQDLGTYAASMRNLRKNELAGVIFGCKNITIKECLSKQLFGLPSAHFQYIRNISPGLPLFLFNYTDRKLHGIFEATSEGRMNINPYGWSTDGSERTEFPAQVKIRSRQQCRPLVESDFKEIIADNYFTEYHFWNELDHTQTSKLISKFASVAVAPNVQRKSKSASLAVAPSTSVPQTSKLASAEVASSTSVPQKTLNWRNCFPSPPSHETTPETTEAALPSHDRNKAALSSHDRTKAALPSHDNDTIEEPEWLEALTSDTEYLSSSTSNLDAPISFGRYDPLKTQVYVNEDEVEQERICMKLEELAFQYNLNSECQDMPLAGDVEDSVVLSEMTWEDNEKPRGPLGLKEKRAERSHSSIEMKSIESWESTQSLCEHQEIIAKLVHEVDELRANQKTQSKKIGYLVEKRRESGEIPQSSCEHQTITAKLIQEVDVLKVTQTTQSKKIGYLEKKLEQAEKEIQRLKVWNE